MKKFIKKAVSIVSVMAVVFSVTPCFNNAFAAREKSELELSGENFYKIWERTVYEEGNNAFARFMFKELFGHEYNVNSTSSRYPISSITNVYTTLKYGDLVEFTKGSDVYSVIVKSADKDGMNVYEAYSAPNGDVVFEGYYAYDKNDKDSFMDGRFKGGSFTIYHSNNYEALNHIHSYNRDGYCTCGVYRGKPLIPTYDELYVVYSKTPVYEMPYTGSKIVSHINPSQGKEKITAVSINGDNEVWFKTTYGWVNEYYLSTEMAGSVTKPNTQTYMGVVYGIESLPVRSLNGTFYAAIGYFNDGDIITITKKLNSWYAVDYNGETGYVQSKYIQLVEPEEIASSEQ